MGAACATASEGEGSRAHLGQPIPSLGLWVHSRCIRHNAGFLVPGAEGYLHRTSVLGSSLNHSSRARLHVPVWGHRTGSEPQRTWCRVMAWLRLLYCMLDEKETSDLVASSNATTPWPLAAAAREKQPIPAPTSTST